MILQRRIEYSIATRNGRNGVVEIEEKSGENDLGKIELVRGVPRLLATGLDDVLK